MDILSPAITSCQYVAGHILETSAGSPLQYLSIIPALLLLKLLLSMSAQQLFIKDIPHSVRKIPQKLSSLLDTHSIPLQNLLITKQSTLEAYVIGMFRPKIVLSELLIQRLTKKQLEAVLLHELFHLQHKHPAIFLLSNACSSVCWFLPIVQEIAELIQTNCEIAADQSAVAFQGTHQYLVGALRSCLNTFDSEQNTWQLASIPTFNTRVLEQRLDMLLTPTLPIQRKISITTLLTSSLVVTSFILLTALKPTLSVSAQAPNECSFAQCIAQCVSERLTAQKDFTPGLYSPADVE